jgi:hypothetical protein
MADSGPPDQRRHDQYLAQQDEQSAEQGPVQNAGQGHRVEEHADADEEQAEQHIPERANARFHLVAEFGFAEHHAGQKRAERQRQAKAVGGPGGEQCDHQHGQSKDLGGPPPGNQVKQRPQQPTADEKHEGERQQGFGERQTQGAGQQIDARRGAQHRYDDQERHGRDVLNTDIASPSRPCGLFSSPCSANWLPMMVEEDWAKTAPMTNAAAAGSPASHSKSPTPAVEISTCAVPSPRTWCRNACNWGSE